MPLHEPIGEPVYRRILEQHSVSVTHYDNGDITLQHMRLDPATRRMVTEEIPPPSVEHSWQWGPSQFLSYACYWLIERWKAEQVGLDS